MKIQRVGGIYYSNYRRLVRLRPKYRPDGDRGRGQNFSGLIWGDATMSWQELTLTYEQLA